MSTSVSKTGNTSSQRSCTEVPSPPSKGGCVSCPPDTICCLFMVLSTSAKRVVTCLRCVPFCVRNDVQPFEKCPFCCSPGSQLPVLPSQRTEAAALTAPQASSSRELGWGSRPNSSETIASCSLEHSFGAVLCGGLPAEVSVCSVGQQGRSWCGCPQCLELWKPAVTDLRHTAALSALSTGAALLQRAPDQPAAEVNLVGMVCSCLFRGVLQTRLPKSSGCRLLPKDRRPLPASRPSNTVYSIVSAVPFHSNQESKLLCFFCFFCSFCFPIPLNGT